MKFFRNLFFTPIPLTSPQAITPQDQDQNEADYNFEVVGESFRRDRLVQIIKKYNLIDSGQLYSTAILKLEPENDFDPTAVMVIIEGQHIGYIPKSMSAEMTEYIKAKGGQTLQVPARVGWDKDSPEPLVGVRLKMEDF